MDQPAADDVDHRGLPSLLLLALLVGSSAGLVAVAFHLSLDRADAGRGAFIAWAHGHGVPGFILVAAAICAAIVIAALLVRRFAPEAAGSGIPAVEQALAGPAPRLSWRILPIKFGGGVLALGSGMALGREGPLVHMGASLASLIARITGRGPADAATLVAAGAGAGLAAAFNAPLAGLVMVGEELLSRVTGRTLLATAGASGAAIVVVRMALGPERIFTLAVHVPPALDGWLLCMALGAFCGGLGVAYNRTVLATLALGDRCQRIPLAARAAGVGLVIALVAWWAPDLVGDGGPLTQSALAGGVLLTWLPLVFLLRFALGALSYATPVPGGLFAPLLVLGAQSGLLVGLLVHAFLPQLAVDPTTLAACGMVAFFTAVVRAPLTGIILVSEMTGGFALLLPMLGACFSAFAVASLLRDEPIYDALRRRLQ